MPTAPKSITHAHLLGVLNTEIGTRRSVRILDAGCGDGELMRHLALNLRELRPELSFELHGFDVSDHGVQQPEFTRATIERLSRDLPDTPWEQRIRTIASRDPWPFPDGHFDVVLSNQVLEHVADHDRFFAELSRVLARDGVSFHLFPLKHYLYEGHLNLPLVHWISDFPVLRTYIKVLSFLGLGRWRGSRARSGLSLDEYAEAHADYMHHFTHYMTYSRALELGKRHGLRASFTYSLEFYTQKLRSLLRRGLRHEYPRRRRSLRDRVAVAVLKYVQGVTLFLEKKQTYDARVHDVQALPAKSDGRP